MLIPCVRAGKPFDVAAASLFPCNRLVIIDYELQVLHELKLLEPVHHDVLAIKVISNHKG